MSGVTTIILAVLITAHATTGRTATAMDFNAGWMADEEHRRKRLARVDFPTTPPERLLRRGQRLLRKARRSHKPMLRNRHSTPNALSSTAHGCAGPLRGVLTPPQHGYSFKTAVGDGGRRMQERYPRVSGGLTRARRPRGAEQFRGVAARSKPRATACAMWTAGTRQAGKGPASVVVVRSPLQPWLIETRTARVLRANACFRQSGSPV